MDDAELLRRYASTGDEAAFAELVARRIHLVHSAAMRRVGGDFHRAKDVSQMVFTLLARKAHTLAGYTGLTGWLYTTTLHLGSKTMRGERRRQTREERAYAMNELDTPDPSVDWARLRPVLDAMMLELDEGDRQTLLWRFFDSLSLAEIGAKLKVSEDAARKRVNRALERIRKSLPSRGMQSSTAALAAILAENSVVAAPLGLAEAISTNALAAAAVAPASGILHALRHARAALGLSGTLWIGGTMGLAAIGAASWELWTAHRTEAAAATDSRKAKVEWDQLQGLLPTLQPGRPGGTTATPAADPRADFRKFLAAYPQARTMLAAQNRVYAARLYGGFFRSAGLSPAQIAAFEDALSDGWLKTESLTADDLVLSGDPLRLPAGIRGILGEDAFRQLLAYQPMAYAQYWASLVAGHADAAGTLSAAQIDQLAGIFAANSSGLDGGSSSLARVDWDAVMTQARALLSSAQWTAAERELTRQRMEGEMRQAMKTGGAEP